MRKVTRIHILLATSLLFDPTIHSGEASERRGREMVRVEILHGKASFYHGKWIGRKTANGEIYRRSDMTAAHKTLPFNTNLRVTNLRNGRAVIVRVNNRGPYIKGRIVDLSVEAAREIGMMEAGVVPVRVEVLSRGKE